MSSLMAMAAGGGVRPKAVQNSCPKCGQQKCTKGDKGEFISYGGSLVCMILTWIYTALHPAAVPGILVIHMNTEARRDQLVTVLSGFTATISKEIVYIVGGDPGEHGMSAEQQMHRVSADDVAKKIYVVLVHRGTAEDGELDPYHQELEIGDHQGLIHRAFFANWASATGCDVTTIDVGAWDEELAKVDGFLKLRNWFNKTDAASIGAPGQYDRGISVHQRAILRGFWPSRYPVTEYERAVRSSKYNEDEDDHSRDSHDSHDSSGGDGKDEA